MSSKANLRLVQIYGLWWQKKSHLFCLIILRDISFDLYLKLLECTFKHGIWIRNIWSVSTEQDWRQPFLKVEEEAISRMYSEEPMIDVTTGFTWARGESASVTATLFRRQAQKLTLNVMGPDTDMRKATLFRRQAQKLTQNIMGPDTDMWKATLFVLCSIQIFRRNMSLMQSANGEFNT